MQLKQTQQELAKSLVGQYWSTAKLNLMANNQKFKLIQGNDPLASSNPFELLISLNEQGIIVKCLVAADIRN